MPVIKGSSPAIKSQNIREFHTGPTYAHTAAKFGKKRADAQAIAVAMSTARRYGKAEGGAVAPTEEDKSLLNRYKIKRNTAKAPPGYDFDAAGYNASADIRPRPPTASKYLSLPASTNIEDRRGEEIPTIDRFLKAATDLDRTHWGRVIEHPMTPFWELFPDEFKINDDEMVRESPTSPLAREAGIDSVEPYVHGGENIDHYAEGGDVSDPEDRSLEDAYDPQAGALRLTVRPKPLEPPPEKGWSRPVGLAGFNQEPPPESIEPSAPVAEKLFGLHGKERYQFFPEKMARSVYESMHDPSMDVSRGMQEPSEAAIEGASNAAGLMGTTAFGIAKALPHTVPEGTAGMFVGKLNPQAAEALQKAGASKDEIWLKTGAHQDPFTGVWMREIPDRDVNLNLGMLEPNPAKPNQVMIPAGKTLKLGDLYPHEELFNLYPWAKDINIGPVTNTAGLPKGAIRKGGADWNTNTISVASMSPQEMKATITHELQHFIQFHEGMTPGGSAIDFVHPADKAKAEQLSALNNKLTADLQKANIPLDAAVRSVRNFASLYKQNKLNLLSSQDMQIINYLKHSGRIEDVANFHNASIEYNKIMEKAFQNYERIYGEAMARASEERMGRSPLENQFEHPEATIESMRNSPVSPDQLMPSLRAPHQPQFYDPEAYKAFHGVEPEPKHTATPAASEHLDFDQLEKEISEIVNGVKPPGPLPAMAQHPDNWIDSSHFEKWEGQKGSNPGGLYRDPNTNEKWYIKKPKSVDHLKNEMLAAKLYDLAGVPVPDIRHTTMQVGDKLYPAIASKIVPGKTLNKFPPGDADEMLHLKENFPVDAWLANWDAVGTGKDNVIVNPNTMEAHRIDMGGALRYRAQGAPKGGAFGPNVTELKTMLDPSKSPDAANVFKGADKPDIGYDAAKRLNQIPNSKIEDLVYELGPDDLHEKEKLLQTLLSRKTQVFSHYFDQVKEFKAQAAALEKNPAPQKMGTVTPEEISKNIKYMSPQQVANSLWHYGQQGHTDAALEAKLALPKATKAQVNKILWDMKTKATDPQDNEMASYLFGAKKFPQPPKIEPKTSTTKAIKDYDSQIEEYYNEMEKQESHQWELAQGQDFEKKKSDVKYFNLYDLYEGQRYDLYKSNSKPVDWQEYTPPNSKTYVQPQLTAASPANIGKLGFNTKFQLYKGGQKGYHGEIFDPAKKASEEAFFMADNAHVAQMYGYPEPYVARAPNAREIDWAKFNGGHDGYSGSAMHSLLKQARKDKIDLLIIHNISDMGGPQTQYAFLNTAGTLRSIHAKFDPKLLHLAHSHWGLLGGGLLTYGMLKSIGPEDEVKKEQPMTKRASGGSTPFKLRGYQESIGAPTASGEPGVRHFTSPHTGMIHSPVPGRTDKISMNVKGGSYVLPASVVSGMGQGNSQAGSHILNTFFKMGPYGSAMAKDATPKINYGKAMNMRLPTIKQPKFSAGGTEEDHGHVPIVAAGGEFVIPPHVVKRLGGGDMKKGHEILDEFVMHMRQKTIHDMKSEKPPKR